MNYQQGDILLFQTDNQGDINVTGGVVEMNGGLDTAVYISLFGGNLEDSAGYDKTYSWWGNSWENDSSLQIRSETQYALRGNPATSYNLLLIKDAVLKDLSWMTDSGAASNMEVEVSIPALNRVKIVIDIIGDGRSKKLEYYENWRNEI